MQPPKRWNTENAASQRENWAKEEKKQVNVLETRADDEWLVDHGRYRVVHQRVRLDEIERHVRQRLRIVDALAGPRFGDLTESKGKVSGRK